MVSSDSTADHLLVQAQVRRSLGSSASSGPPADAQLLVAYVLVSYTHTPLLCRQCLYVIIDCVICIRLIILTYVAYLI